MIELSVLWATYYFPSRLVVIPYFKTMRHRNEYSISSHESEIARVDWTTQYPAHISFCFSSTTVDGALNFDACEKHTYINTRIIINLTKGEKRHIYF